MMAASEKLTDGEVTGFDVTKMIPDCKSIRINILHASSESGHGHLPTSFSIIEMLYAVYSTMRHDPKNAQWNERDIFVLSKGHAALGHYAVLANFGYLPVTELKTFGAHKSRLGCHADRHKVPGCEASTGSLGHGIGIAVGMALAFKLQVSSRRVYVLIGDGESNEGSVWEAIMVAVNLKLSNLTVLYDNNNSQVRSLPLPSPVARFQAFGCNVIEVNGHDVRALQAALKQPAETAKVIVANTIKGYGSTTLAANIFEWHRKSPNAEQLAIFSKEIEEVE